MNAPEIVPANHSGGATTSHTIVVLALEALLAAVGTAGTFADFQRAVLEDNVLGKDTIGARRRTLRYLRELYVLHEDSLLFRALGDLWNDDSAGHRPLAGLCALARDPLFRASAQAIFDSDLGDEVTSADLADAVMKSFPESYSESTLAKIGRNTSSSWEQTGHLEAVTRTTKVRHRAVCTPATTAFALFLGHLDGLAGRSLFDTVWAQMLDQPRAHLIDLAKVASQRSLIDFRHSGGITEVGFGYLLRPMEGHLP
ncbi:MAG: hypothetical protein ABSD97_15400 [Acidimicrobiales bacterium]